MTTERPADVEFERGLPVAAILDEYLACAGRMPITAWVGGQHARGKREAFHASGGGCLRRDILRWDAVKGDPTPGISLRRFAVGNLIESVLENAFRWKGVLVASQVRVWRDWALRAGRGHREDWIGRTFEQGARLDLSDCLIQGTLDGVVRWSPEWAGIVGPVSADRLADARTFLVDWKSCHERKLDYLDKEPVDAGYAIQLVTYASAYIEQYSMKVDEARLIYVGKDTMRVKQVGVLLDEWVPKAHDALLAKRTAAEPYAQSGVLPAELPLDEKGKRPWACDPRYCEYAIATVGGKPICPGVAAHWAKMVEAKPDERKSNGADVSAVRRATKMLAKKEA